MAENKQYITQIQDNGTVMISEDVIAAIVAHTVNEVEGVAGLTGKALADISDFIGKKNFQQTVSIQFVLRTVRNCRKGHEISGGSAVRVRNKG